MSHRLKALSILLVNNAGSLEDRDVTPLPFAAERETKAFMQELILMLMREVDRRRSNHVATENVHVFYHGRGWSFQREEQDGYSHQSGELQLQSTRSQIEIDRIVSQDVGLIPEFLHGLAEQMEGNLVDRLFTEIEAVANETGNTVQLPKEGPIEEAMIKMIEGLDLFVGPDGRVSRPELCIPQGSSLLERIAAAGPEFARRAEEVWAKKEEEARARERDRLGRYDVE